MLDLQAQLVVLLLQQRLPQLPVLCLAQPGLGAFELHLQPGLLDPLLRTGSEIPGQPAPGGGADQPLGGVELPPVDAVAVVVLEQVMEVVIPLAEGEEGQDAVVPRTVAIGEGLAAPDVGKGVDEEGGMVGHHHAQHPRQQQHAEQIPMDQAEQQRDADVGGQGQGQIVPVLEGDHGVVLQIPHIAVVVVDLALVFPQHPADVGVPEAAARAVGILLVVIHVTVVTAVIGRPVECRVLQGEGAADGEDPLQGWVRLVGLVGPESVITGGDGDAAVAEQQQEAAPLPEVIAMGQAVPGYRNQCRQPGEGEQQGVGHDDRGAVHFTRLHSANSCPLFSIEPECGSMVKKSETNLIQAPPSGYHLASLISR
ncbi:hypothetical protein D3C87_1228360 [compost metagenome]